MYSIILYFMTLFYIRLYYSVLYCMILYDIIWYFIALSLSVFITRLFLLSTCPNVQWVVWQLADFTTWSNPWINIFRASISTHLQRMLNPGIEVDVLIYMHGRHQVNMPLAKLLACLAFRKQAVIMTDHSEHRDKHNKHHESQQSGNCTAHSDLAFNIMAPSSVSKLHLHMHAPRHPAPRSQTCEGCVMQPWAAESNKSTSRQQLQLQPRPCRWVMFKPAGE